MNRSLFYSLSLLFLLCFLGCGTSSTEDKSKTKGGKKTHSIIDSSKTKESQRIADSIKIRGQLQDKYNAIRFLPKDNKPVFWTYQLQKILLENKGKVFLFEGQLQDVEMNQQGVLATIECYFHDTANFTWAITIRLELLVSEDNIDKLSSLKRIEFTPQAELIFNDRLFIVAKIDNIKRINYYEISGSVKDGHNEESEIEISALESDKYVATGKLIEALPIPAEAQ